MNDKNNLTNNIAKSTLAQGVGSVVSKAFGALMTTVGLPEAVVLTPLVRGATIGVVNKYYDDFTHRMLSTIESQKLDLFSQTAVQTFFDLAERDGVRPMQQQIEEGQLQYAYEAAEGAMLIAIRQSQRAKIKILGRFFGSQLYQDKNNWQDIHQTLNMADALTVRQLVMIRLIAEDFKGMDKKLFISNPTACVEINRLLDFGIWQTAGAQFGINKSWKIQLESIIPTIYSEEVCKSLMLESLSEDDINEAIKSLSLTTEGTPEEVLTADDYKKHTQWQEFDQDGNIKIDGGLAFEENNDPMSLLDAARGK
ncbi:MAG: hypothetical protein IKH35_02435 [Prevotella sp.]|nr:hypothetical protein [Prevotella sp.]